MSVYQTSIGAETRSREELCDSTREVKKIVVPSGVVDGIVASYRAPTERTF